MRRPCPTPCARARPRRRGGLALAAVGALTAGLLVGTAGPAAPLHRTATAPAERTAPLDVGIDELSPAVLPRRGRVTVAGTVVNTSEDVWQDVAVYPVSGAEPITSAAALAEAASAPEDAFVGERTVEDGAFDVVGDLAPGESATYRFRVPREDLAVPGEPGVYWFGVHALGGGPDGRDDLTDGRARTFVPSLGDPGRGALDRLDATDVALVLPVRRSALHRADGSLRGVGGWTADLGLGGALRSVAELGEAVGQRPVTWLLDPAVLDAAQRLQQGNPGRSLAPTMAPEELAEDDDPAATASAEPTGSPSVDPSQAPGPDDPSPSSDGGDGDGGEGEGEGGDGGPTEPDPPTAAERVASGLAGAWLRQVLPLLRADELLVLPYGDLDVDAAAGRADRLGAALITRARALSDAATAARELVGSPAVAPPEGYLDPATVARLDEGTTALVVPQAFGPASTVEPTSTATDEPTAGSTDGTTPAPTEEPTGEPTDEPTDEPLDPEGPPPIADDLVGATSADLSGRRAVLLPTTLRGPGPDDPDAPVAVRQRLLAEAAVRALEGAGTRRGPAPLVAVVPDGLRLTDPAGFVTDVTGAPWLRLADLGSVLDDPAATTAEGVGTDRLVVPDDVAELRLGPATLGAAERLLRRGQVLESVLTLNDRVDDVLAGEALGTASYAARRAPTAHRAAARRASRWVGERLGGITVTAPPSVTLSSASGRFAAALANDLDEPVTVRLEARTDAPITIEAPAEVRLAPGERTSVLLTATSDRIGLHEVELVVTDTAGVPLGSSDSVPIRSAQVSWIIWVVVAAGGALLFGMIALRLVRRVRAARAGDGA